LAVEKVEFFELQDIAAEQLTYDVKELEAGKKLLLTFGLAKNTPPGRSRGKIRLHLSHPLAKTKELRFLAFVRGR
jgi:hypothetical protein